MGSDKQAQDHLQNRMKRLLQQAHAVAAACQGRTATSSLLLGYSAYCRLELARL
jgi:hypothetical protein